MATTTSTLEILVKMRDEASQGMKRLGFSFDKAVSASKLFAGGLVAGGAAVGGFGAMALKSAADLEQMEIAFTTMLGSAEKAGKFTKDLINFAKRTPFELTGLQQASKQLLAYGFAQEEVIPNLKALGDIASGVGMDKLPNLILAFGQVKAATRLTGMELRQFTEAGVPLLDELAKQFGVTAGEVQKMISAGEVGFEDVRKAIVGLTEEGGRFNNLMDKQAGSLSGMISNLKDAWEIFLMGEGKKLLEWAKQFTQLAIKIIQEVLPSWIKKIESLIKWFRENKAALIIVTGAIIGALIPAIYSAVTAFAALAISLAPFIIGGAIIGGIVAGVLWIVKNWDILKAKTVAIWTSIKDFFSGIWQSIKDTFASAVDWIMNKLQPLFNAVDRVKRIGSNISGTVQGAFSSIKSAVGLAQGGIVTRPTLAVVGEGNEPEAVMPLSRLGAIGGGGITINLNGDIYTTREVALQFADEIIREVKRQIKI